MPELEQAMQNDAKTYVHNEAIQNKQQKTDSYKCFTSLTWRQ